MPSITNDAPTVELELSLEEQWVVHHVLTEYIDIASGEDADLPKPVVEIALAEKIEAGTFAFTAFELEKLRFRCRFHARNDASPDADRSVARSLADRIDDVYGQTVLR
ncbi:hypothetical protein AUR64_02945 [Haloprofundus marisrubri]|uniref:Uncharacterized protein n=1 Tax=Haloprofundus marisrubri TaxID=1514971 RepID=A0A0W1R3B6_9EURY|nr:hypothetical protein [Haloprofundus marisrubri]KTG07630.1 hypothetical protein AUR64_02945 [Haloprofundus marisrubri]